jgi:hypothetical protein
MSDHNSNESIPQSTILAPLFSLVSIISRISPTKISYKRICDRIAYPTSNIVEENVQVPDFLEIFPKRRALVVESLIDANFLLQPFAFVWGASNGVHLGPGAFAQLTYY